MSLQSARPSATRIGTSRAGTVNPGAIRTGTSRGNTARVGTARASTSLGGLRRKGGVSDVLGSILILAMTVSLFVGVFAFVDSIPHPEEAIHVQLLPTLDMSNDGNGGWVNITHSGGESLGDTDTYVIVRINNTALKFNFSQSNTTSLKDSAFWSNGGTFSRFFGEIQTWSVVQVLVLDRQSGDSLMESMLSGGQGYFNPQIRGKGYSPGTLFPGTEFRVYATIEDPDNDLNPPTIRTDLTEIGLSSLIPMTYELTSGRYVTSTQTVPPSATVGAYFATIFAEDFEGHQTRSRMLIWIGVEQVGAPDLYPRAITFSDPNPTNGDTVEISTKIWNEGTGSGTAYVRFYIGNESTDNLLGIDDISVAVGDQSIASIFWPIQEGGNHTILVNVTNVYPPETPNIKENIASTYINVLPNILIVDDDGYGEADGTPSDTADFMEAAVTSAGFEESEIFRVVGGDGPRYDVGEPRMSDYDIVIWITGYAHTTLTVQDQASIEAFLNNGGKLWLVSESMLEDLGAGNPFVRDRLHITSPPSSTNMPSPMIGNTLHELTAGPPLVSMSTTDRGSLGNSTDIIGIDANARSIFNNTDDTEKYGLSYQDDDGTGERLVFIPWEFSNIHQTNDQAYFAYRVILWLINLTGITGEDISVSQQDISTLNPLYRDYVNVSAVIRNNGASFWNVTVALVVDGEESREYARQVVLLAPKGGSAHVSWDWEAFPVGLHTLSIRADPDNIIEETNENNNEIDARSVTKDVFVDYSILVIDDDGAPDGDSGNVTAIFLESLDVLGVRYHVYNRDSGYIGFITLLDFNLVVWITGADEAGTLNESDRGALSAYMDYGGYVWLIGQGIADDLDGSTFLKSYIHVQSVNDNQGTPTLLEAVDFDPITHGIVAPTNDNGVFPDDGDSIVPDSEANGIFWQDSSKTSYNALSFEDEYKMVFFAFELAFIKDEDGLGEYPLSNISRNEIVYEVLRFMDRPSTDPELKTAVADIQVSNQHPFLGSSYVLRSTVYNRGSDLTNALVQFFDGDTLIGSDNIPVLGDDSTSVEVIWTPLYAGNRNIIVRVDSTNLVDEPFDYHNNNATYQTTVYFFWDDMENGSENWRHSNVIMRENGESPLEYYGKDLDSMETSIITGWSSMNGVKVNYTTYHTQNSSYHFEEDISGESIISSARAPMDIILITDTSMTMNAAGSSLPACSLVDGFAVYVQPLCDAQMAAINFIQNVNITNNDRIALVIFDATGTSSHIVRDWTTGTSANKLLMVTDIKINYTVSAAADSPLFESIFDVLEHMDDRTDSSRDGYVLFLAGGADSSTYPTFPGDPYDHTDDGVDDSDFDGGDLDTSDDYDGTVTGGVTRATYPIFTVALDIPGGEQGALGDQLNETSTSSNGTYYFTTSSSELSAIYNDTLAKMLELSQVQGASTRTLGTGNSNKSATTSTFDLTGADQAMLTFWHKYNILPGTNGAFVEVGYHDGSEWRFIYASPSAQYTGNLLTIVDRYDDDSNAILWAWNDRSASGTLDWERAEFNLLNYVPLAHRDQVRVRFNYTQYAPGMGQGWWVDDIEVAVTRDDAVTPASTTSDIWAITDNNSHSGNSAWGCTDPDTGYLRGGLDNSLITTPIDLSKARTATLSAYFKFNINNATGLPPDGFRIEVTQNSGESWSQINLGLRAAQNLSGTETGDGNSSETGIDVYGEDTLNDGWVELSTLSRVEVDLSSWIGRQIHIRFRVVTNALAGYDHFMDPGEEYGILLDNVIIYGTSLLG